MSQHDQVINDGTGVVVRNDINAALAALFSSSQADTEPDVTKAGQVWFDTGVDPAVLKYRNEANTGWIRLADPNYTYSKSEADTKISQASTAIARNKIVNPTCQVSQENTDMPSISAASQIPPYYAADQWGVLWSLTGGTATGRRQTLQTADTGSDYVTFQVGTPVATPGSGDRAEITQDIEGINCRDLNWYTNGGGKDALLRFNFYASVAGTYTAFVRGPSYSYFVNFDASIGWKVYTFPIPAPLPQTAGTWVKNNTKGVTIGVGLTSGAGFKAAGAGWQQTNQACQAPNASNGAATAGAVFGITDVGFYADPQKTGKAPPFEVPDYATDFEACRRYWFCSNPESPKGAQQGTLAGHSGVANVICFGTWRFDVPMRIAPAAANISLWSNGNKNMIRNTTSGAAIPIGGVGSGLASSLGGCILGVTTLAAGTWVDFDLQVNCRM